MARTRDWRAYKKLIVAVVGAVVMTGYQFLDDNALTGNEKIQVASAAVGAFLVWQTANGPKGRVWNYAKATAFGVTALLATLMTTLPNGVTTTQEVVALAISFLTGAGVLAARNDSDTVEYRD